MLDRLRSGEDHGKLEAGLAKTRTGWRTRLASIFGPVGLTDETWEALEIHLVQADVGPVTAAEVVAETRALAREARIGSADQLWKTLRRVMLHQFVSGGADIAAPSRILEPATTPFVVLMVGVNGSGKTTSIAKLAARFTSDGRSVVLVAGDTFRAAAIEQLQIWGQRAGAAVLAGHAGADPAAVVYDALSSRAALSADVVIVDTAGRLHTQNNLMAELAKVYRVCGRLIDGAPHATLLVLDATTGQNGLLQAREFGQMAPADGVVLAKLDSSAKGGVAFAIRRELGLPILFVGTGESLADFEPFDPETYVDALLGLNEHVAPGRRTHE